MQFRIQMEITVTIVIAAQQVLSVPTEQNTCRTVTRRIGTQLCQLPLNTFRARRYHYRYSCNSYNKRCYQSSSSFCIQISIFLYLYISYVKKKLVLFSLFLTWFNYFLFTELQQLRTWVSSSLFFTVFPPFLSLVHKTTTNNAHHHVNLFSISMDNYELINALFVIDIN